MKVFAYLALIGSIRSALDFSDIPLARETRIDPGNSKTFVMHLNQTKSYSEMIKDHLFDKHMRVFADREDVFNKDGTPSDDTDNIPVEPQDNNDDE